MTRDDFAIRLTLADADHLLALVEWALNQENLNLGPGLRWRNAESAARKIESVADLHRRGVDTGAP